MRQILLYICCLVSISAFSQEVEGIRQIDRVFQSYNKQREEATFAIQTSSAILPASDVYFRAGKSVTLTPGFFAHKESVVNITIGQVNTEREMAISLSIRPNPVSDLSQILYTVPNTGEIELTIFDLRGHVAKKLVREFKKAGSYQCSLNDTQLVTGYYVCVLKQGNRTVSERIVKE